MGRGRNRAANKGPLGGRSAAAPSPRDQMKRLEELQTQMLAAQAELENKTVEVSVGGGVITLVMTGHQKLVSVTIKPEVLNPEDAEMVQDLIIAAVNEGVDRSQELASQKMGSVTGSLGIDLPPGLL
ncbi:MAG: YbaB/EbfC family nucleoid-associated protein [Chloroflexi bacterium]|nr:YbaB/EbfC family nucleoid-associated protein [Chloroflexota bacterium]